MNKHTWTLCAAALIAAAVGMKGEVDYEPPKPGTYQLPVIKSAADGEVLDVQGGATRLGAYVHGKVTVLSFIYSRCGDAKACPFATGVLRELHEASEDDATLAKGMRLVSLSFDPAADTPEKMRSYAEVAASERPAAEWHFLTTKSEEKLRPILEAYGQSVARKENPADPTGPLNHNLRVLLIDPAGKVRNIYSSGTLDERLVLADVRTLLMETKAASGGEVSAR